MYFRAASFTAVFSLSLLSIDISHARAGLKEYMPSHSNSVYDMTFSEADENNYQVKTYEKLNGNWLPKYYNYTYQIAGCTGSPCYNRPMSNFPAGQDVNGNFYGINNYGGVSNSGKTIGKITGDFLNNTSTYGAGVSNKEDSNGQSVVGDITGDFINNYAYAYGGAINNNENASYVAGSSAIIGNITGNFIGNHSEGEGGAIYNYTNTHTDRFAIIGNIKGDFIANETGGWGGAINNFGYIGNVEGNFISNHALSGGAFMNSLKMGDVTGDFIANTAEDDGGAILIQQHAEMGKIRGNFIGNAAERNGGAIFNGYAKNLDVSGDFIENKADFGGAIVNVNNAEGLYPATSTISNSSFINNTAETAGGAIYHEGVLTIVADNYESVFQGNSAGVAGNDIYVDNGKDNPKSELTLSAVNGGSINFYGGLDGDEGYQLNLTGDADSQINFHADINNGDINVGTLPVARAAAASANVSFDDINNISNKNNSFIMNSGAVTFDNLALDEHKFRELKLNGGEININNADVDLANVKMGRMTAEGYTGGDTAVKVHHLNVTSDKDGFTAVDFADASIAGQVQSDIAAATGPVYDYQVDYLTDTGQFTFARPVINDEVKIPSYAAVAAVSVLSDEIYSRVLSDADSYLDDVTTESGVKTFAKVFGSDDHIDLKGFADGDSKYYGVIAGLETNPQMLGSGWKSVYNTYLAYAAGEHKYSAQRIDQESGYLGGSGIFYKDDFFVGSTVNIGLTHNHAKGYWTEDKFTSRLGGIALKTGYNYDLGSGYALQPNLYGSYTYINSDDYKTRRGAVVKIHDISNYELAPGLKISKQFDDGLQVYAKGRYVFVFNDNQDAVANNIMLPDVNLKNYAEFGLGVEKNLADKGLNSYLEVTRREGGREGWNGIAGIKLAL